MSEQSEIQDAKDEAVEAVVDRVSSWQAGNEEDFVAEELREGFTEAEVEVPEGDVQRLAGQIHDEGRGETEDVTPS